MCRKIKRKSISALQFEISFEKQLIELEVELKNKKYELGQYSCFAINEPKIREVWAADFRDRIVHHLLIGYLEPIWEKIFIFHSYACRKNKGGHLAINYVKKSISSDQFYLQADIQSYFTSIDKNILFSIIKKHVNNPDILWLSEKIIFHNPTSNYIIKGDKKLLSSIPRHKSLFENIPNKGLPIGNLTSQFFANVYLNELDQFIKHKLKCKNYFRYMDDILILHSSKSQLLQWQKEIENFLETKLKLKLHPKKNILQKVNKGINFCGYIIKPNYILIRRRTVKKLKNKLWQFNKLILKDFSTDVIFENPYLVFPQFNKEFIHIFSSINSSYGFLKHANCYGLRKSLYKKHFGILKIYLKPANRNYDYFVWNEQ